MISVGAPSWIAPLLGCNFLIAARSARKAGAKVLMMAMVGPWMTFLTGTRCARVGLLAATHDHLIRSYGR